jgi:hypothetical protein
MLLISARLPLWQNYRSDAGKTSQYSQTRRPGTLTLINIARGSAYSFLQSDVSNFIGNQLEP